MDLQPGSQRRHSVAMTALAVSLGLHALAGVAFLRWGTTGGTAELAPDVISINIVPSVVLEATEEQESQSQEAATAPAIEGAPDAPKPEEETQKAEPADTPAEAPKPEEAKPSDAPIVAAEPETLAPKAEPKPAEKRPPATNDKPARKKQPPKQRRQIASTGKGTGAHSGRVSASRGDLASYADSVRTRIARHKTGSVPQVGTATVAFSIAPSGGLAYARLQRSSGNTTNDAVALQAVRAAAPFPPPPGGQRFSTSVPFYFK